MLLAIVDEAPGRSFPVTRTLTSVGRSSRCHLRLEAEGVAQVHAVLHRRDEQVTIAPAEAKLVVRVNGRRIRQQHDLKPGDALEIGAARLEVLEERAEVAPPIASLLDHLARFSACVIAKEPWPRPAEVLLESALEVTGAEHGFIVLASEGNAPRPPHSPRDDTWRVVASAPAMGGPDEERVALSSNVVRQVLSTGQPVLLGDAARSPDLAAAPSVARLKLRSVVCLPLTGEASLLGALYLGSTLPTRFGPDADHQPLLRLFCAQASSLLQSAHYVAQLRQDVAALEGRLDDALRRDIIAASPSMARVLDQCARAAPADVSVLLEGETGTGKELLARLLHDRSPRASGPFVAVNCAAIAPQLLESELFGHARGAFTGADQERIGLIMAANGGTLFLDEIGELQPELQPKLLRVLEEHAVRRVGDHRSREFDARVVAATNRDLVADGAFRPDLYYRLAQIVVKVPPLRERPEDLELLARAFLRRYTAQLGRPELVLSDAAWHALEGHRWPGNARELQNRIRQAVLMCDAAAIGTGDLGFDADAEEALPLAEAKDRFVARYVRRALQRCGGDHQEAARSLGISVRSLYRYLKV